MILPHKFQDAEKFNLQFSDFSEITETADKLRWLRYQKGLRQRDVADYAGIYRSTYIHYEEYGKDFYSPKHMEKIAQLFEVPVERLLDDYNLFLRNGQGKQIKAIRMKLGLTQREYADKPYVAVNGNVPYFTESELTDQSYEYYSNLDALGRCGTACASIGQDLMPTESRGSIGMVKPSGWHTVRYDDLVDGKYLYNRCHLIGYQLTGENANTKNLITGTRYLNIEGMLPFENMVADYVKENGNHVMYRVTPIFEGDNLLANGVLMEGYSVEDKGAGVSYCVFAYNVQPGIEIDYATGESKLADSAQQEEQKTATVTSTPSPEPEKQEPATGSEASQADYILNTNTKKFHYPTCSSVNDMKEKNKQEFFGTRDEAISNGYSPCGRCKP